MALENYVFYVVEGKGGIKPGRCLGIFRNPKYTLHSEYYNLLLMQDPWAFDGIEVSDDWSKTFENVAEYGNIIIANTAVEVERLENRLYGIYLPSNPCIEQLEFLNRNMEEFEKINIDVGVYGSDSNIYRDLRLKSNLTPLEILKIYINEQKNVEKNKFVKEKIKN